MTIYNKSNACIEFTNDFYVVDIGEFTYDWYDVNIGKLTNYDVIL